MSKAPKYIHTDLLQAMAAQTGEIEIGSTFTPEDKKEIIEKLTALKGEVDMIQGEINRFVRGLNLRVEEFNKLAEQVITGKKIVYQQVYHVLHEGHLYYYDLTGKLIREAVPSEPLKQDSLFNIKTKTDES